MGSGQSGISAKVAAEIASDASKAAMEQSLQIVNEMKEDNQNNVKAMKEQHEQRMRVEEERAKAYIKQIEAQGKDAKEAREQAVKQHETYVKNFQQALKQAQEVHAADVARTEKMMQQMSLENKEARVEQNAMFEKMMATFSEQFKEMLMLIREAPSKPAPMPGKTPEEMEELRKEAKESLGIDSVRYYNFGFTGNSGVGKSSFINAMRGLMATDPGAAEVDEIECTADIREYIFPQYPHIRLWDIPGAGTQAHPSATYFMDKKLYALDGLVIIFSARFLQVDVQIAKSAKDNNVPYLFVRSMSDQAIDSKVEQKKMDVDNAKNELREQVKKITAKELEKAGMFPEEPYCCSTRGFVGTEEQKEKYGMDEPAVYEAIVKAALSRRS